MSAQPVTIFAVALIGAAGLNAALAAWTVYLRTRGYFSFALLMLALSWWSSAYAMELTSRDLASVMLWVRLEYIAIVAIPPLWLIYAWRYGGYDSWIGQRRIVALAAIPLITLALVWTNPAHHLIWTTTALTPAGDARLLDAAHGRWFWVHTLYSYALILTGSALFLRAAWDAAPLYRAQGAALTGAGLVPLAGNLLYLLQTGLPGRLDLTPLLFTVSGLLCSWAGHSSRLLTIVPVARNRLIEAMGDGLLVLDGQGRVADINLAGQQIFTTSFKAALAQPLAAVAPSLAAALADAARAEVAAQELTIGAGPTARTYDVRRQPFYSRRGRHDGSLVVLRDISQRKRDEAELRAQRELFAGLAAVAQAAAARPTLRETLRDVLSTAADLVGAAQGSIFLISTDRAIFESVHTHRQATPAAERAITRQILATGLAGWAVRQRAVALVDDVAHDPRWLPIAGESGAAIAVPILEHGQALGVITLAHPERGFFHSEHARLMQAVAVQIALAVRNAQMYETQRELAERAEASSRAKSAFLATMSHELRTPLNAILGYSQLIAEDLDSAEREKIRHDLDQISVAGQHLLAMVNDVLDLARIEAGQARTNLDQVDLDALVANVVTDVSALAAQNNNTLSLECAELGLVTTDLAKLRQILMHLLTNACKFTSNGRVTLRARRPAAGDQLLIEVSDTGIGITAEQIAQLFTPFTQGDMGSTRRHGGMGLGLALCQQLCQLLGGTISVESTPGQGSTFTVSLPAEPAAGPPQG